MENKSKTNRNVISRNITRLAMILGMGALTGVISIAALSGLFILKNAFANAILFMAGPGAIITALTFEGQVKERMLAALLAGVIATILVVLAAGIGTKLLSVLNLNVLRITGGIAVLLIGLVIMGLQINDKIPMVIIGLGIILAGVWR
jgi:small neutral amino acid transporter SnatA (MarC family)